MAFLSGARSRLNVFTRCGKVNQSLDKSLLLNSRIRPQKPADRSFQRFSGGSAFTFVQKTTYTKAAFAQKTFDRSIFEEKGRHLRRSGRSPQRFS